MNTDELQRLRLEARQIIREHRRYQQENGFTDRKEAAEYGRRLEAVSQQIAQLEQKGE